MWVRGLKLDEARYVNVGDEVAPYVGAWIETRRYSDLERIALVAPYVGAWIETPKIASAIRRHRVAPYVGAWIETTCRLGKPN